MSNEGEEESVKVSGQVGALLGEVAHVKGINEFVLLAELSVYV
jgi:hypothetical protein